MAAFDPLRTFGETGMAATMEAGPSQHCYVDFNIRDEASFRRLASVVEEFQRQKETSGIADDAYWLPYFEDSDREEFWWPSETESQQWHRFWFSTPLPQRHSPTMPTPPWHFGSLVDAVLQGDYDLIGVQELSGGRGRLEFDPRGYPYALNSDSIHLPTRQLTSHLSINVYCHCFPARRHEDVVPVPEDVQFECRGA
jgi:hypothetical protein